MKYPIGIQTFEEIITGGYQYVDKTDLVYKLVDEGKYYFLSRPRRFGKSLLTTTLEAYFKGKKDLFKGLAMEHLEKDWVEYPVFHIDFTGDFYSNPTYLEEKIISHFEKWEVLYGKDEKEKRIGTRFENLVIRACEKTGKKAVILIDEYDKPLTDTIGMPDVQDQNRATLQSLYGIMKRADQYIRFAFLTGVTRYGKLGIFSAANNPDDISMSEDYASICGISESELHQYFDDEIQVFAERQKVSKEQMYERLKKKYDGYHFCANSEDIYNPFSLLGALKSRALENKWFATGTPTYLTSMLKRRSYDLTKFSSGIDATAETMASFGNGEENMIAALYQSGYLTIKSYDSSVESYVLGFPNEEVANGFVKYLIVDYMSKGMDEYDADFIKLKRQIMSDDVESFMTQIRHIMAQIPFESNESDMMEIHFRNMIYLMIRFSGFNVFVELPVLGGRIDIFFETDNRVYVIECKRDQSADEALAQIDMKKYDQKISSKDKPVVKIGANFSTEERNIVEWKVEENKCK
ncbi:MAG: ATP-binding protein [Paludibacteraceae bacterium]|nr:ATP-binding protein [Paludibacteraceae bacterium]